jgi:hypothetical protein
MDDELFDVNVRYMKEPEPEPVLPEGTTAKQALEMVYRGLIELTPKQMRAAIELLPYENPKLSATAIAIMDGDRSQWRLKERSSGANSRSLC